MFEFKAKELKKGDEFTLTHGEEWYTVITVNRGTTLVGNPCVVAYCSHEGWENTTLTLNLEHRVIVK